MSYKVIVFDWDGTLYDSGAYIVACLQAASKEVGITVPSVAAIRNVIGLSFDEALKKLLPNVSSEQAKVFEKAYRFCISGSDIRKPVLFEGAEGVLQKLTTEGYWLAVATGKSRRGLDNDLATLGIGKYFMTTRCADEAFSKPHPKMLLDIIDELGVDASKVLMIGDTEYDLGLAENAHVDALAVDYGMHERERLLKYKVKGCISDIRELPEWLVG